MQSPDHATDALVDRAVKDLRAALALSKARSVTILIDPAQHDPFASDPLAKLADQTHRVARLHDDQPDEQRLYLLHVSDEERSERLVNRSVHIAVGEALASQRANAPRSVCAWLLGTTNPGATVLRIYEHARVVRPDHQMWPLRFWDPRVIGHLPRVLRASQFASFGELLAGWWYINGNGAFARARHPGANAEIETPPLRFDTARWDALARIGIVNEIERLSRAWGVAPSTDLDARIDRIVVEGLRRGCRTPQDVQAFACCALTKHEAFYEDPEVQQRLQAGGDKGVPVAGVLAGLDEATWKRVDDRRVRAAERADCKL
jgi:hypothetical protein